MSKSNLSPIEKAVRDNSATFFADVKSPYFVIAVSGGIDSMSLLYTFARLNIDGVVAHVNYQKRGVASDKDADLVAQKVEEWGFEYELLEVDPKEAENKNFQQWARNVRYRFFRDLMVEHNADGIVLAHHKDDQVETILQKLLRGAGMASWSGMDVWDGELFRPLLEVSCQQIDQYAEEEGIPFRTDESNLENDFARNFLRNEWSSELSEFFPGWQENVLQMRGQAKNYKHALDWISDQITDENKIDKQAFDKLEPGLQRALILHLLKKEKQDIHISQQNLHRVQELKDLQTGKTIGFTPDFCMIRDRHNYVLKKKDRSAFDAQEITRNELEGSSYLINGITLSVELFEDPDFEQALYLDAQKVSWPITVRPWQDGDRLQPLGMEGHQTVAEHLTNRKISAALKDRVMVIESFEETICALIFPPIKNQSSPGTISEQVKCDSETKFCLTIK